MCFIEGVTIHTTKGTQGVQIIIIKKKCMYCIILDCILFFSYSAKKTSIMTSLVHEDTVTLLSVIKNGRVNLEGESVGNQAEYPLYSDSKAGNICYQTEALKSIISKNRLQELFFSCANTTILQNTLRRKIWELSDEQFVISPQSHTQLQIIMRSVYLQFGENLPRQLKQQVERLNALVLEYAVPNVMSNVKQYMAYLNNVDKNPIPLEHPEYISNTGLKGL